VRGKTFSTFHAGTKAGSETGDKDAGSGDTIGSWTLRHLSKLSLKKSSNAWRFAHRSPALDLRSNYQAAIIVAQGGAFLNVDRMLVGGFDDVL